MKAAKLTLDFADRPELVDLIRRHAARVGKSQKAIVSEALEGYFANLLEDQLILRAADDTFAEWDNAEDAVYDTL